MPLTILCMRKLDCWNSWAIVLSMAWRWMVWWTIMAVVYSSLRSVRMLIVVVMVPNFSLSLSSRSFMNLERCFSVTNMLTCVAIPCTPWHWGIGCGIIPLACWCGGGCWCRSSLLLCFRAKYLFYGLCDGSLSFALWEVVGDEGCTNSVFWWIASTTVPGAAYLELFMVEGKSILEY